MVKTIIIILAIVVVILFIVIYLLIKAFGSAAGSIAGIFDGLSGGAIGASLTIEKKARYQKSFIARLFHQHKWKPRIDSTLHYSKTEKICYICGATK
jgi:hypothetical protein